MEGKELRVLESERMGLAASHMEGGYVIYITLLCIAHLLITHTHTRTCMCVASIHDYVIICHAHIRTLHLHVHVHVHYI